ncbi:MAG: hypothetical protein IKY87_01930 [Paludibacteraceae bacterium]|nr:hypothetical protein [Paludibacteraceae bacterium]
MVLVNYNGNTPEVYMGGTYTIIPEGVSTDVNNVKMPIDGSSLKFLHNRQLFILRNGNVNDLNKSYYPNTRRVRQFCLTLLLVYRAHTPIA